MRRTHPRGPCADEGFTLIEVTLVLAILTVAIMGTVAALGVVLKQSQSSVETATATQAIRSKIEEMRSVEFDALWPCYRPGGLIGSTFAVEALPPPVGGGAHGTIAFLGEGDVEAYWGRGADFDGDGDLTSPAPTDAPSAASWTALPVRLRVRWSDRIPDAAGAATDREVAVTTIVYDQNR